MDVGQELADYRFRTVIKTGNKKDHTIKVDARKIALKNNVFKRGSLYSLDFRANQA